MNEVPESEKLDCSKRSVSKRRDYGSGGARKRVRLGPLSRSGSAAAIAPIIISLRFIGCMNTWNMPLNKKR